jgi:hypothetical protein
MRRVVWSPRLGGWIEPTMERIWFFGRVAPRAWRWRWLFEAESSTNEQVKP